MSDQLVPPSAFDLDGKKVFIQGYMARGRQQVNLKRFRLCPVNGDCKFCTPNPKPAEILDVTLAGDLVTNYTNQLVRIGGRFHVDPLDPHGLPYSMECDYLR